MGDLLSTPSSSPDPNPSPPPQDSIPMSSSSKTPKTEEPKPQSETPEKSNPKESDNPVQETQQDQDPESQKDQEGGDGEEEEEEGECGFCLFMKGGECKDAFIDWEKCVQEAEEKKEDIVDKCHKATAALKECMEAHPDYYGPILNAEKEAEKEAREELKAEEEQAVIDVEKEQEGAKESAASGNQSEKSK